MLGRAGRWEATSTPLSAETAVTGRAKVSISPPLSLSRSGFGRTRFGFDFLALRFGGDFAVGACLVAFAMAETSRALFSR
jgi:hypothetical protein